MVMLPSLEEMDMMAAEARCQKVMHDFYEKHKEEFDKGLLRGLFDGFEAFRISPDGDVKFVTKEELQKLIENGKQNNEC